MQAKEKKIFCFERKYTISQDLSFLFKYNKELFENKKCPKLIYLTNHQETEEAISYLKSNLEKIHTKYSDMESYHLDVFRNFSNLSELENILDKYATSLSTLFPEIENKISKDELSEETKINLIKQQLKNKPYLLFNKYGDVKAYSQQEFDNIADSEMIYNYFDKFSILNNKTDFLFMNDFDFIFLIFLDGKKIDYTHPNFKIFRKIFFNINFFNVKFFVCTSEHKEIFGIGENEKVLNNIYLLKRKNIFNTKAFEVNKTKINAESGLVMQKEFSIENEKFELINITQDLQKTLNLNLEENSLDKELIKKKLNIEGFFFIIFITFQDIFLSKYFL